MPVRGTAKESPALSHEETIDCRTCGKPLKYRRVQDLPFFPFCSRRCKLLDLGAWLDEEHRIPTELPPEDAAEGEARTAEPEEP